MIRIRLQRRGRKKRPIHHIVVADSRAPRDGRIIENLGRFDNLIPNNQVKLNEERAIYWIQRGAQPSDTVRSILKNQGILYKVHLINWGKSEEEIEQALEEWREAREAKTTEEPSRKERQQALLEAEEKEYQKQLKKKAEEAARQKAKEEALAAEQEKEAEATAEEETKAEEPAAEEATEAATETEEPAAEAESAGEADEPEVQKEATTETEEAETAAEETEEEKADTAEEAETASEPEVQKEAEAEAKQPEEEEAEADDKSAESDEDETEASSQVSTDMTAKEAIQHISNTDLDELEGFVPEDEDRVTVQRAWESKQED